MNFLPLFLKQLRNSRTSTLLNLFGLTIALSSFIILIAQVRYELTYDTHFRDADRIFRIERDVPTSAFIRRCYAGRSANGCSLRRPT